ncbi:Membrane protein involved in the export of O-antigen and teichoic acid [Marinococcus luteus]|uniref:Membrane protein involved in the export of O-antigen and teichoic acid n=1 Tax=Marinococcus luteus TaxID=1122204 RepID=A0A1H2TG40_9BACI|nr:lipopolysaccharide biosynthesis protein [Marinococcus luteus]SDW42737.1 Membrane protein involved in the export of O-antigen and teichoic acid [Marinococcus luteus]
MLKKIKVLTNGSFVRNVIILASGTAGAQVIVVASSPLITRIYGPEAFGLLGVFLAMITIVTPAAALTYPIAIVLAKNKFEAKEIIKLSLILSILLGGLSFVLITFFQEFLINTFNIRQIAPYLFFIPLIIVFGAMLQVSEQWLIRINNFKTSAKVKFNHSILLYGSMIVIGLITPVSAVLVTLAALGNLIKSLMMTYYSLNKSLFIPLNEFKIKKEKLFLVAKEYNDFPKYRAPQEVINAASKSLPIIMLSTFFGPAAAGFYSIGNTVLKMPSQLIAKSVGDVFYPRITKASFSNEKITPLMLKATMALILVGIIPFGIIIAFGPPLFDFIFGNDWYKAGEYARWIAIASFFSFINRPSVKSLPALKAQRFHLLHEIASVILRVIALVIGFVIFENDMIAVVLFSVVGALLSVYLIVYSIVLAKREDEKIS